MAPILGYWDIRGVIQSFYWKYVLHFLFFEYQRRLILYLLFKFAQPIRFILAYTGTEYDEKRYKQVVTSMEPITVDRSEWLNDKPNLGLDFPNVNYNSV